MAAPGVEEPPAPVKPGWGPPFPLGRAALGHLVPPRHARPWGSFPWASDCGTGDTFLSVKELRPPQLLCLFQRLTCQGQPRNGRWRGGPGNCAGCQGTFSRGQRSCSDGLCLLRCSSSLYLGLNRQCAQETGSRLQRLCPGKGSCRCEVGSANPLLVWLPPAAAAPLTEEGRMWVQGSIMVKT